MICKTITAVKGVDRESVMVPINISKIDRIWFGLGGGGVRVYYYTMLREGW